MTKREIIFEFAKVQGLIGQASAAYGNDRAPDRADRVITALDEAFEIAIRVRGHFPAEWGDEE